MMILQTIKTIFQWILASIFICIRFLLEIIFNYILTPLFWLSKAIFQILIIPVLKILFFLGYACLYLPILLLSYLLTALHDYIIKPICSTLFKMGIWINNKIINPMGIFFTHCWRKIKEIGASIATFFIRCWQNIKNIGASIAAFFRRRWKNIKDIGAAIADFFRRCGTWINTYIMQPIADFFMRCSAWINNYIMQPIANFFRECGTWLNNNITPLFEQCWRKIKRMGASIGSFFERCATLINTYIIQPICNFMRVSSKKLVDFIRQNPNTKNLLEIIFFPFVELYSAWQQDKYMGVLKVVAIAAIIFVALFFLPPMLAPIIHNTVLYNIIAFASVQSLQNSVRIIILSYASLTAATLLPKVQRLDIGLPNLGNIFPKATTKTEPTVQPITFINRGDKRRFN